MKITHLGLIVIILVNQTSCKKTSRKSSTLATEGTSTEPYCYHTTKWPITDPYPVSKSHKWNLFLGFHGRLGTIGSSVVEPVANHKYTAFGGFRDNYNRVTKDGGGNYVVHRGGPNYHTLMRERFLLTDSYKGLAKHQLVQVKHPFFIEPNYPLPLRWAASSRKSQHSLGEIVAFCEKGALIGFGDQYYTEFSQFIPPVAYFPYDDIKSNLTEKQKELRIKGACAFQCEKTSWFSKNWVEIEKACYGAGQCQKPGDSCEKLDEIFAMPCG